MTNGKIAVAIAGGYLLGRTKKAKLALGLGMLLAGKKITLDPQQLARAVADSPLLSGSERAGAQRTERRRQDGRDLGAVHPHEQPRRFAARAHAEPAGRGGEARGRGARARTTNPADDESERKPAGATPQARRRPSLARKAKAAKAPAGPGTQGRCLRLRQGEEGGQEDREDRRGPQWLTRLGKLKDDIVRSPAADRLKDELQSYVQARATHALSGLGTGLAKGTQALAEGKSPGQAVLKAGTSQLKESLKDKVKGMFGKGRGKSGGGKSKSVTIVEDIDVGVPRARGVRPVDPVPGVQHLRQGRRRASRRPTTPRSNWQVKVA